MQRYLRKLNHPLTIILIMIVGVFGIVVGVQAYPKTFEVKAEMQQVEKINPEDSLIIEFSKPMITNNFAEKIAIFPAEPLRLTWKNNNTLIISPQKFWLPGNSYSLKIRSARSRMFTSVNQDFTFEITDYPAVSEFYPANGAQDVLLDIEDPIRVSFDRSIENFRIKFVFQPWHELAYEVSADKKEIKLLPKGDIKHGEKYNLDTYIRYKKEKESQSRLIFSTFFETKPLPPKEWDKNLEVRIEQAKKFTEARISEGKYIDINLKSQVMTIFEKGKILDAYLVSTGKRGMDTKQGQFAIRNKFPRAWSKKYGLFMPYWMAIVPSGEFGIHELPEWPGGYKEGRNHLGIPVSHGCIRLGVGPAKRVYDWAEIGTPVVIYEK